MSLFNKVSRKMNVRCWLIVAALASYSFAYGQLSGTYTIGSSGADYATFNAAVASMEAQGLSGEVTFNVQSGGYNEQVLIDGLLIAGNDQYGIRFVGQGSTSAGVVLSYSINAENSDYTLEIEGTNDISFERMTFQNASLGNFATVVTVGNNEVVSGITFDDCQFLGQDRLNFSGSFPTLLFFSGGGANNIVVNNCVFRNNYFGLTSFGTTEVTVTNNQFYNQNIQSMSLSVGHAFISNNYVENDANRPSYSIGLEVWNGFDFIVDRNTLIMESGAKGLQIQNSSLQDSTNNIVSNNFMNVSNGSNSIVGVTFDLATQVDFVHNTVRISSLLSAISFTAGNNVRVYNNILQNTGNGSVYSAILGAFHDADYNIASSGGIFSTLGASLEEHQENSGLDQNSMNLELEFVSDVAPDICHYAVSDAGVNLNGLVTADYNNTSRNTLTPDIGAYEFELPTTTIFATDTLAICDGEQVSLEAENLFTNYLWLNDSSTAASIEVDTVNTYHLQVEDAMGCLLLDSIYLDVQSVEVDLGEDQVICVGNVITLETAEGLAAYTWSNGATTSSIEVTEPGTYSVIIENELGCTAEDEVIVSLSEDTFDPNFLVSNIGCTSDTIQFAEVSDLAPDSVFWDFGDGGISEGRYPQHVYGAVGDYTVTMTATIGDCALISQKKVVITSTCTDFLVAYYPLDTAANDISDNEFNGALVGDLQFVTDSERGAVASFDGVDDYIELTTSSALDLVNSSFTVSAWVKFDEATGNLPILGNSIEQANQGLNLGIADSKADLNFFDHGLSGRQTIAPNEWNFISYSYDLQSQTMTIYVNGERDATIAGQAAFEGFDLVAIGLAQGNYFSGYIDDLRIWKDVLTDEEIFENWSGYSTDLIAWYELTASGDDSSGNAKHGEVNGNVSFVEDAERGAVAQFGGANTDYIMLDRADSLSITESSFVVSAWVKVAAFDKTDLTILGSITTEGRRRGLHLVSRAQNPHLGFWAQDTRARNVTLQPDEWVHLTFIYDQEEQTQIILLNGKEVARNVSRQSFLGTQELLIGNSINFNKGFNGYISDLKIRKINDATISGRIGEEEETPLLVEEVVMTTYPNPAIEYINISIANEDTYKGAAQLFDLQGTLRKELSLSGVGEVTGYLNLSDLEMGMYFLKVSVNGKIYSNRVVKRN